MGDYCDVRCAAGLGSGCEGQSASQLESHSEVDAKCRRAAVDLTERRGFSARERSGCARGEVDHLRELCSAFEHGARDSPKASGTAASGVL